MKVYVQVCLFVSINLRKDAIKIQKCFTMMVRGWVVSHEIDRKEDQIMDSG